MLYPIELRARELIIPHSAEFCSSVLGKTGERCERTESWAASLPFSAVSQTFRFALMT